MAHPHALPEPPQQPSAAGFDWSYFHFLLAHIPPGRWTSYGDLANEAGTGARAVGHHLRICGECANAWRVLSGTGASSTSFSWGSADRWGTQEEVLMAEGIAFDGRGRADPNRRVTWDEYDALRSQWQAGFERGSPS